MQSNNNFFFYSTFIVCLKSQKQTSKHTLLYVITGKNKKRKKANCMDLYVVIDFETNNKNTERYIPFGRFFTGVLIDTFKMINK